MKTSLSNKWYQRRLAKYFDEHYSEYEDEVEFWNDPEPCVWLFNIPSLDVKIELRCRNNGNVEVTQYPIAY